MAIFRVNRLSEGYAVISWYHLRDKSISLKAKGLLSQMLSFPPGWHYTFQGLVSINLENETAIKSALRELRDAGYLVVTKQLPNETESGRIEWVYDIYERPKQEGEKQWVENQPIEFQPIENPPQYQIEKNQIENINNSLDSNAHKDILYSSNTDKRRFRPPSVEEVDAYIKEQGYTFSAETFVDFYSSKGWKVGSQPMKDWKAACRTWQRRRDEEKKTSPQKPAKNSSFDLDEFFQASLLK